MRIWTEEQEQLAKKIRPWWKKDPTLESVPEEIRQTQKELVELTKKIRLENS